MTEKESAITETLEKLGKASTALGSAALGCGCLLFMLPGLFFLFALIL